MDPIFAAVLGLVLAILADAFISSLSSTADYEEIILTVMIAAILASMTWLSLFIYCFGWNNELAFDLFPDLYFWTAIFKFVGFTVLAAAVLAAARIQEELHPT